MSYLKIDHYFEFCVGPEDVTHPKPHPESLHLVLEHMSLDSASIVFVGDTEYDLKTAQAANVRSLAVATGYATRAELEQLGAEAVFDDMTSLVDYLMK